MRTRTRNAVIAVSLLVGLLAAPTLPIASEPTADVAKAATESWLALVDAGEYATSWDRAAALFKSRITQEGWVKAVGAVRGPLGQLESRKLRSRTNATTLPGVPDGTYVVFEYDAAFAKNASAVETVTATVDPDGKWRVAGYFVR